MTVANKRHIKLMATGFCLACSMLFTGCGNDRPKEVLSEKKMVKLMADMELAEAYANMSLGQQSHEGDYRLELGRSVLAAHGVTQQQLDTTLAWYGRNLDDYSELYTKVDKEILSRKKKLLNLSEEELEMQEADILWKYGKNGTMSALGNTDSWIFSVSDPDLQKGDRLQWSMHIDSPVQMNGVLGVEYEDGSSDAATTVFIGRNRLEITCHTDTSKVVRRVYGTMRVKDIDRLPIFADSISVIRLPFDSMEYKVSRNVKHYGIPVVKKPKLEEKKDSVEKKDDLDLKPDSIDKIKPVMWNAEDSQNRHSGEALRPVHAKPERVKPPQPSTPLRQRAKPIPPHEQGGVMKPVKKDKKNQ